jgi:hypothetical protein
MNPSPITLSLGAPRRRYWRTYDDCHNQKRRSTALSLVFTARHFFIAPTMSRDEKYLITFDADQGDSSPRGNIMLRLNTEYASAVRPPTKSDGPERRPCHL